MRRLLWHELLDGHWHAYVMYEGHSFAPLGSGGRRPWRVSVIILGPVEDFVGSRDLVAWNLGPEQPSVESSPANVAAWRAAALELAP